MADATPRGFDSAPAAAERAALGKLLANWRCMMENVESRDDRAERKTGQKRLFE